MIKLYRQHKNGVGSWEIGWIPGKIVRVHKTGLDHLPQIVEDVVIINESGRSLEQQTELEAMSLVSRMRDKGYKDTVEEAMTGNTNQLGLVRPMLAQKRKDVRHINYEGAQLQKKLNGHRCLITRQDAYTRNGKWITTIGHILETMTHLPEGETVDGELYRHGISLQTISSWIKRDQPNSRLLGYVAYDMVSPEKFTDRYRKLREYVPRNSPSPTLVLGNRPYTDEEDMIRLFRETRNEGFEGLILRTDDCGYEVGTRSNSLIKIKEFFDDEFKVIGISASKRDWAICTCVTADERTFDVLAPGTHDTKKQTLIDKDRYVGKYLTVSYSELTDDGTPFQPIGVSWKEEI
jgi:DNA ligase 1